MTLHATFRIASQANLPLNLTYFEVEELAAAIAEKASLTEIFNRLVAFLQSNGSSQTGNYRLGVDEVKSIKAECF